MSYFKDVQPIKYIKIKFSLKKIALTKLGIIE